jgi:hypothetical protein
LFLVSFTFPLNRPSGLLVEALFTCAAFSMTTGRLLDAGLSRFWACVMLPTLAAPWLCPLLNPGARPNSVLAQFFKSIFLSRNWTLTALAVALLAVPLVIGLLPTRSPEAGAPPRSGPDTANPADFSSPL